MRTLDERLTVRFPALLNFLAARVTRMPVGSRLRGYLVERRTCQGFQGVNRGDLELLLAVYHEDAVISFDAIEGGPPDFTGERRGRTALEELWDGWNAMWEDLFIEPRELIDFGDRLFVTVEMSGRGRASGVPFSVRYFDLYTLRSGRIARHDMFRERVTALAAAGAPPAPSP